MRLEGINMKKVHVNLSLSEETNRDLTDLAKKYNMSKSGLVNFFINQAKQNNSNIFLA